VYQWWNSVKPAWRVATEESSYSPCPVPERAETLVLKRIIRMRGHGSSYAPCACRLLGIRGLTDDLRVADTCRRDCTSRDARAANEQAAMDAAVGTDERGGDGVGDSGGVGDDEIKGDGDSRDGQAAVLLIDPAMNNSKDVNDRMGQQPPYSAAASGTQLPAAAGASMPAHAALAGKKHAELSATGNQSPQLAGEGDTGLGRPSEECQPLAVESERWISALPKRTREKLMLAVAGADTPAARLQLVVASAEADTTKVRASVRRAFLDAHRRLITAM